MRHRLTRSEREIRKSRGIPLLRILPFAAPLLVLIWMSADTQLFQQCLGHSPPVSASRGAAWARLIAAVVCSPIYLRDAAHHWLAILLFFGGIALAVPQFFWIRRHTAYWNGVRAREKAKRAAKAVAKSQQAPPLPRD